MGYFENEKIILEEPENLSHQSDVIIDTNVILSVAKEELKEELKEESIRELEHNSVLNILKDVLEISEGKKINKIIITSPVYSEIELIKKSQVKSKIAAKAYAWLGKVLIEKPEVYEYVELPKHSDGVDDALIEFALEREASFISLDIRCNIRYCKKKNISPKTKLDEEKLIKLISIVKHIKNLKEENLYQYLQKIFDSKKSSPLEFIKMSPKERLGKILMILIDEYLGDEENIFVDEIKRTILRVKLGEISDKVFFKNLSKLKGYNFGEIDVKESLLDQYSELIEKFLKEKGFDSFKELEKSQPFLTEDELVKGIIRYYGIEI